jgi:hypothetical protein
MTRDEIKISLFQAINAVQEQTGSEVTVLDEDIIPRFNLMDFDSHKEISVVIEVETLLNTEIGTDKIFYDSQGGPVKLKDVIDSLDLKINAPRKKRKVKKV